MEKLIKKLQKENKQLKRKIKQWQKFYYWNNMAEAWSPETAKVNLGKKPSVPAQL